MKRFILISIFFVLGSMLLCTDVVAQTKTPTLYQRLQPRSQGSPDHWMLGGRYETSAINKDRRAAEQGNASAQFKMALRYDLGRGVAQDYAESVKWLYKASEQGLAEAQYNLGSMYYSGLGVSQDSAEAALWFRKAADQGLVEAQKNLGSLYGRGEGVPQSHAEAFVWSSVAVMAGSESAINNRDYAATKLSPEEMNSAHKRATALYEETQQ